MSTLPMQKANTTVYRILIAISFVHLLNDAIQSVVPAMFPILKHSLLLSFTQIGLIGFALNITASILQPLVGILTDARPRPYLLPIGMACTAVGVVALALAPHFDEVLLSVMAIGVGSAILHPESSRVAYMAAGGRRGFAQAIFQVGGNLGQALAPIMTALIFVPLGQFGVIWFTLAAGIAIFIQLFIARWYKEHAKPRVKAKPDTSTDMPKKHNGRTSLALTMLIVLVFSKFVYQAGIVNYYPFYLIQHFGLRVQEAQYVIFSMLAAGAIGTFFGGPLADRFGRRNVIWFSILGTAPFALALPYVDLFWSVVFSALIGLILLCSFSVIIVYAQELLPGKVGMVSGLFFGLAFGLGGIGSAALGSMADHIGIVAVMKWIAYLPLFGFLAIFLPSDRAHDQSPKQAEV